MATFFKGTLGFKFAVFFVVFLGLGFWGKQLFAPKIPRELILREYGSYAAYLIVERKKALSAGNLQKAAELMQDLENLDDNDFVDEPKSKDQSVLLNLAVHNPELLPLIMGRMKDRFQAVCVSAMKEAQIRSQTESLKILAQHGCLLPPPPPAIEEKLFEMSAKLRSDVLTEAKELVRTQNLDLPLNELWCSSKSNTPQSIRCITETEECPDANQCLEEVYAISFRLDESGI